MTDSDPSPAPPPDRVGRNMARLRWLLVAAAALLCAFSWWSFALAEPAATAAAPRYFCPMHPEIKAHDPGECPICHMTLEPIPASLKAPRPKAPAASAPPTSSSASALPVGVAPEIELSLSRLQAINVRTRKARALLGSGKLSVPAVVEAQERGRAQVHVRSAGFVERIAVREVGARVKAGQELFALYSPEIFQAQAELLALAKAGGPGDPGVERAKRRLSLLGVSAAHSEQLLAAGAASRAVPVSAPISGYVAQVRAVLGAFVSPETALYELVDPARVYVVASVPESRAAEVALGQSASFSSGDRRLTGKRAMAKIDLIYPELDRAARSVRVRLSLDNPEGAILPGQFGSVELELPADAAVAVPRDAVIDTGRTAYVFIDEGQGRLRAAPVEVGGVLPNDELEIRRGVKDQELVVSGAAFLIDSESRLRAAIAPVE